MCNQKEENTRLTAATTGSARAWTFTYNSFGHMLNAQSSLSDAIEKTRYVYDASGRAGLITYANGATLALAYNSRGWLTSQTDTSSGINRTTSMSYAPTGLLTRVTLPDGAYVSYGYDAAHRLISVSDNLGNTISYTLDNMGNRTKEMVSDNGGVLARQVARMIDVLNRVKQVTGAM